MDAMKFPLSYKDINDTGIERCNIILKKSSEWFIPKI